MTQAVLEGVAFSFRDAVEGLAASGLSFQEADVIGGGSQSALWTSIIASILDVKLHRLAHGEQGVRLVLRVWRVSLLRMNPFRMFARHQSALHRLSRIVRSMVHIVRHI